METEKCPRCKSGEFLEKKLLLIGRKRSAEEAERDAELIPGPHKYIPIFADEIKEEYLRAEPVEQFVDGMYCNNCKIGFVPDGMIKD
jgi:hypothetical protein